MKFLHFNFCSGISRFKRELRVWPASQDTPVYEQQPFLYWCNESRPISACEINFQAWGHTFKLNETARDSVFEYPAGAKFNRGECGIRIFKTVSDMSGAVFCSVLPVNQDADSKSSIFLRVQTPPSRVVLFTDNKHFEFKEGESMAFYCSVKGGKPDTIELLIGDEVVASSNKSLSVSFTKEALFSDHKQKVVCRVHHETFTQPQEDQNIIRVSCEFYNHQIKLRLILICYYSSSSSS
jgi:hypothetical protein